MQSTNPRYEVSCFSAEWPHGHLRKFKEVLFVNSIRRKLEKKPGLAERARCGLDMQTRGTASALQSFSFVFVYNGVHRSLSPMASGHSWFDQGAMFVSKTFVAILGFFGTSDLPRRGMGAEHNAARSRMLRVSGVPLGLQSV